MLPTKFANYAVEGNNDLMLRVYVTGGGCSVFLWFNFAESVNEDDAEFMNGDVKCSWIHSATSI